MNQKKPNHIQKYTNEANTVTIKQAKVHKCPLIHSMMCSLVCLDGKAKTQGGTFTQHSAILLLTSPTAHASLKDDMQ